MSAAAAAPGDGVVTKVSPRTVAETVARFTGIAQAKGLKVFAVIDQAAEARQAGPGTAGHGARRLRQPGGGHSGHGGRAAVPA